MLCVPTPLQKAFVRYETCVQIPSENPLPKVDFKTKVSAVDFANGLKLRHGDKVGFECTSHEKNLEDTLTITTE